MPRIRGHRRKKTRTHKIEANNDITQNIPKSFIIHRGSVEKKVKELKKDMRKVMLPYSSSNLKEKSSNSLKDYVSVANAFGVTHIIIFTQTDNGVYLKIGRIPQGPTLTFLVSEFTCTKDVINSLKKKRVNSNDFKCSPLLVLNGFKDDEEEMARLRENLNALLLKNKSEEKTKDIESCGIEEDEEEEIEGQEEPKRIQCLTSKLNINLMSSVSLITTTLSNLFPPIDVKTIKIGECRRVVLFNFDPAEKKIFFRHYVIIKKPAGITRGSKKLIKLKNKKTINLSKAKDISDLFLKDSFFDGNISDSEIEEEEEVYSAENNQDDTTSINKFAIRLIELGPRMQLKLVKAEEDLCGGKILFHRHIKKVPEELLILENKVAMKKLKRKKELHKFNEAREKRKVVRRSLDKCEKELGFSESKAEKNKNKAKDEKFISKRISFNPFSFKKKKKSHLTGDKEKHFSNKMKQHKRVKKNIQNKNNKFKSVLNKFNRIKRKKPFV